MGSVIWSTVVLVREEGTSTLWGGGGGGGRVNQFVYLFKFTSQIPIPAFTDIMSTELFLKFFFNL